ncbi:MAG TPA: hypothetical protein VFN71_07775 [Methylomirabilota bacterium]|nr:hypothetical protein [Methylomirabilota bacterium]
MAGERSQQAEAAHLAAVIERAGDIALYEEPARFVAALEEGDEREGDGRSSRPAAERPQARAPRGEP